VVPIYLSTVQIAQNLVRKLILRKIIKIDATRCHILQLKCTKFDFGWGSTPDPAGKRFRPPSWI